MASLSHSRSLPGSSLRVDLKCRSLQLNVSRTVTCLALPHCGQVLPTISRGCKFSNRLCKTDYLPEYIERRKAAVRCSSLGEPGHSEEPATIEGPSGFRILTAPAADKEQIKGSEAYSNLVLKAYDVYVLLLSCRIAWQCPSDAMLGLYNRLCSDKHLDVGVGTGYFLDNCKFPTPSPSITLLDLNANCLQSTALRIKRYNPTTRQADLLKDLPKDLGQYDSIGMNFVLHCLPGSMLEKGAVLKRLRSHLSKGGRLFGSTILGPGPPHNALANFLMKTYNKKGIFSNTEDDLSSLKTILSDAFSEYSIEVKGSVALFEACV